jgi:small GTP-binding protein
MATDFYNKEKGGLSFMALKPSSIQRIEKAYGIELKQLAEMPRGSQADSITHDGYVLSEGGGLMGLVLNGSGIGDICPLSGLMSLKELYLSHNQIRDVSNLSGLTSLTRLNLYDNQITDVSALSGLMSLEELYLSRNQATNVSSLSKLTSLKVLNLSNNRIYDVSGLSSLTNLEELYLSHNKINDVSALSGLTSLEELYLSHNQIRDVSSLSGLTSLTRLNLYDNQITDVSSLGGLTRLDVFSLSRNQICDVSGLSGLVSLTQLNLSHNQIADVSGLSNLTSLKVLNLSRNLIVDVFSLSGLMNLTQLNLSRNSIHQLPSELYERGWSVFWDGYVRGEGGLNLYGNPLETPPVEIFKQGNEAVQNYFDSLKVAEEKGEQTVRLYEAKLLVVGPGNVGKTFLSNRLIYGETPPTESTEGIDIHKWMVDAKGIQGFRINLWDFGGQEIYHATHQFFLTKRSLYLFVWEARRDDDRVSFGYWLNVLKLLSDNSPVIMVMNKCDERRKPIDQTAIQKQFGNVIGFYEVSAKKKIGIDSLRVRIIEEIEKLEQIGTTLPKQWMDIRGRLEGMKGEQKNYITYQAYKDICAGHHLNEEQADHLADYYHELGVILRFADNPVLQDIVFLSPEWATDAVYMVTDHKPIQKNYGRFHFDQLKRIWKDYPENKYSALLELMMKFELCFNLEGTKEYIIPELLRPEKCFYKWSYKDNLHFQYKYDFMPAGIITRFMVRKHHLIKDELCWKNGMVMEWEGTYALIESNEFDGKIDVWIKGEDKKEMLGIIRCDIEHIHETLNKPKVDERMPCICSECKINTNSHFYNYHDLRTLLRKNVRHTRCMKSADEISIDELLGTYGIGEEEGVVGERGTHGEDARTINIENYYEGDHMEIRKQINKDQAHVINADEVNYTEQHGISREQMEIILDEVNELMKPERELLKKHYEQLEKLPEGRTTDRDSMTQKIRTFLVNSGIAIAQSLTAAGIYDLGKMLFS